VPACLVAGHAPFVWGETAHEAAHNAVVLEAVARMAYRTLSLKANAYEVSQALLDRHYFRKHGKKATYGQHSPDRISRTDLGHLRGLPPEAGGDSES
jgi:L-ribulose-5-phosphate 4-epimerase